MQYTLKKSLGQHFLNDAQVCLNIKAVLQAQSIAQMVEVGPGGGALTQHIHDLPTESFKAIELDREKIAFLLKEFPYLKGKLIEADFLAAGIPFDNEFVVVGNFPYNISTQIVFKVLEWREQVPMMVNMWCTQISLNMCIRKTNKCFCRVYGVIRGSTFSCTKRC